MRMLYIALNRFLFDCILCFCFVNAGVRNWPIWSGKTDSRFVELNTWHSSCPYLDPQKNFSLNSTLLSQMSYQHSSPGAYAVAAVFGHYCLSQRSEVLSSVFSSGLSAAHLLLRNSLLKCWRLRQNFRQRFACWSVENSTYTWILLRLRPQSSVNSRPRHYSRTRTPASKITERKLHSDTLNQMNKIKHFFRNNFFFFFYYYRKKYKQLTQRSHLALTKT